jgi:hypothetical protein
MFQRILSTSHVKVSKSDWAKIEQMFKERGDEIIALKAELSKTEDIRKENERLKNLDAQDELLFETEQYCKRLIQENRELKETLRVTADELDKTNVAFKSSRALESLYLQKISEYKRNSSICTEYSTRSYESLIV